MSVRDILMAAGSAGDGKLYVDDVFSAYTRTGTGSDATVTTGIDMTKGYMLWTKSRSVATDHALYHSARGVTLDLVSNNTAAQTTQATGLKSVSATGHTVGALAKMNTSSATYVDWVFRNADKFYNHAVVTKSSGSNATVSFPGLGVIGMVRVKLMDSAGSWYIWHRSLSAGQLFIGESTIAATTLGYVTVSGATVTLVNGVIEDGTYLVEAFAHDEASDGMIQCGLYSGNGTSKAVNLGWEPQFLLIKRRNAVGSWRILDIARGFSVGGDSVKDPNFAANTSDAEDTFQCAVDPTSTGFVVNWNGSETNNNTSTYIYLAIRRPNKPPTSGTQVYNAIARTGTGATAALAHGFAPDLWIASDRASGSSLRYYQPAIFTRLLSNLNAYTGGGYPYYSSGWGDSYFKFSDTGVTLTGNHSYLNASSSSYVYYALRRAPGFFDEVLFPAIGTQQNIQHGLGVPPELMIVKCSGAAGGSVYAAPLGAGKLLYLMSTQPSTSAASNDTVIWNNTAPTDTHFSINTSTTLTYSAFLFASLPGVSKIGSYIGNGGSQNIDCGFSAGARFFLVKATSTTGDWWMFDSARGIVSGTESGIRLNSTAPETAAIDVVDPYTSGITVNQEATCSINASGVSYIYWAIA